MRVVLIFLIFIAHVCYASELDLDECARNRDFLILGKESSCLRIPHVMAKSVPYLRDTMNRNSDSFGTNLSATELNIIGEYITKRFQNDVKDLSFYAEEKKKHIEDELNLYTNTLLIPELSNLTTYAYLLYPEENIPLGLLNPWSTIIETDNYTIDDLCNHVERSYSKKIYEAYIKSKTHTLNNSIIPCSSHEEKNENKIPISLFKKLLSKYQNFINDRKESYEKSIAQFWFKYKKLLIGIPIFSFLFFGYIIYLFDHVKLSS